MSEEANKTAPVEAAPAAPEVAQPAEAAPAEAPAAETKDAEAKTEEPKADDKTQPMIKTTAKIDENHAQNVKSDPNSLPETDDPNLIRGQVHPSVTLSPAPIPS